MQGRTSRESLRDIGARERRHGIPAIELARRSCRGATRLENRRDWFDRELNPILAPTMYLKKCPSYLRTALTNVADLEAECFVFAIGRFAPRS